MRVREKRGEGKRKGEGERVREGESAYMRVRLLMRFERNLKDAPLGRHTLKEPLDRILGSGQRADLLHLVGELRNARLYELRQGERGVAKLQ